MHHNGTKIVANPKEEERDNTPEQLRVKRGFAEHTVAHWTNRGTFMQFVRVVC